MLSKKYIYFTALIMLSIPTFFYRDSIQKKIVSIFRFKKNDTLNIPTQKAKAATIKLFSQQEKPKDNEKKAEAIDNNINHQNIVQVRIPTKIKKPHTHNSKAHIQTSKPKPILHETNDNNEPIHTSLFDNNLSDYGDTPNNFAVFENPPVQQPYFQKHSIITPSQTPTSSSSTLKKPRAPYSSVEISSAPINKQKIDNTIKKTTPFAQKTPTKKTKITTPITSKKRTKPKKSRNLITQAMKRLKNFFRKIRNTIQRRFTLDPSAQSSPATQPQSPQPTDRTKPRKPTISTSSPTFSSTPRLQKNNIEQKRHTSRLIQQTNNAPEKDPGSIQLPELPHLDHLENEKLENNTTVHKSENYLADEQKIKNPKSHAETLPSKQPLKTPLITFTADSLQTTPKRDEPLKPDPLPQKKALNHTNMELSLPELSSNIKSETTEENITSRPQIEKRVPIKKDAEFTMKEKNTPITNEQKQNKEDLNIPSRRSKASPQSHTQQKSPYNNAAQPKQNNSTEQPEQNQPKKPDPLPQKKAPQEGLENSKKPPLLHRKSKKPDSVSQTRQLITPRTKKRAIQKHTQHRELPIITEQKKPVVRQTHKNQNPDVIEIQSSPVIHFNTVNNQSPLPPQQSHKKPDKKVSPQLPVFSKVKQPHTTQEQKRDYKQPLSREFSSQDIGQTIQQRPLTMPEAESQKSAKNKKTKSIDKQSIQTPQQTPAQVDLGPHTLQTIVSNDIHHNQSLINPTSSITKQEQFPKNEGFINVSLTPELEKLLNITKTTTPRTLEKTIKSLLKQVHPDKKKLDHAYAEELTKQLNSIKAALHNAQQTNKPLLILSKNTETSQTEPILTLTDDEPDAPSFIDKKEQQPSRFEDLPPELQKEINKLIHETSHPKISHLKEETMVQPHAPPKEPLNLLEGMLPYAIFENIKTQEPSTIPSKQPFPLFSFQDVPFNDWKTPPSIAQPQTSYFDMLASAPKQKVFAKAPKTNWMSKFLQFARAASKAKK